MTPYGLVVDFSTGTFYMRGNVSVSGRRFQALLAGADGGRLLLIQVGKTRLYRS